MEVRSKQHIIIDTPNPLLKPAQPLAIPISDNSPNALSAVLTKKVLIQQTTETRLPKFNISSSLETFLGPSPIPKANQLCYENRAINSLSSSRLEGEWIMAGSPPPFTSEAGISEPRLTARFWHIRSSSHAVRSPGEVEGASEGHPLAPPRDCAARERGL